MLLLSISMYMKNRELYFFFFRLPCLVMCLWAGLFFSSQTVQAQCGVKPIYLKERIAKSNLVVEGRVTAQRSVWDKPHHNIYTIYTIEVLGVFKGNLTEATVQVVSLGGQVGTDLQITTNELELHPGKTGLFTLLPTRAAVQGTSLLYEAFAAKQGFIAYEKATRKAKGTFETYATLDKDLYPAIQQHTHQPLKRTKQLQWNTVKDTPNELHTHKTTLQGSARTTGTQAVSAGATITGFSPTTIQAGTTARLTITGSGFGATQGSSKVSFPDANSGGSTTTDPLASQYISWSDTQIIVEVPSDAGTGIFRVTDGTNTVMAGSTLTIEYAISNLTSTGIDYRANLINDNTTGGYTFQLYTDFDSQANAKSEFLAVLDQWRCTTGIHWTSGSTTSVNTIAGDGVNVVRFDIGTELPTGVLGRATSRYAGCTVSGNLTWFLTEIDVCMDDGTNFFYGSGSIGFSQYDFYSVMLHELGHAQQLGHVIAPAQVMHYAIANSQQKRILSAQEIAGASYELNQSLALPGFCSTYTRHVDYTCNSSVTLSTGSSTILETGGSTSVTATLSKRNFYDVTVNLSFSGSATLTADYTLPTSITIPSGSLSGSVTLAAVGDALTEGNETVTVDISSVTNGTESGIQQQTITITDDDTAPSAISLSTAALSGFTATVASASTAQTFTVSGSNLTANINLSLSTTDYELSTDNSSWSSSLALSQSGGMLIGQPVTLFVRLKAGLSAGTKSATLTASSSGATNQTITLNGTTTHTMIADVVRGNMLSFDGTDDYVNLGNQTALKPTAALTVELWAYQADWSATTGSPTLIGNAESGGYVIYFNATHVQAQVRRNGADAAITALANFAPGWHHFALTYDGRFTNLYLDGTLKATDDAGGSFPIDYHPTNSTILGAEAGSSSTATGNYFFGHIDEVRIWNTARTQTQLREAMHLTLTYAEAGLAAYYQCNEAAGDVLEGVQGISGIENNGVGHVLSTVSVGGGISQTVSVLGTTAGNEVSLGTTQMAIDFNTNVPNGDLVITQITGETPYQNTTVTAYTTSCYWIVRNFGNINTGLDFNSLQFQIPASNTITSVDEADPNNMKLYKRNHNEGGSWTEVGSASAASNTSKQITFPLPAMSSFSEFIIGSDISPLPVTLISFQGKRQNAEQVLLSWQALHDPHCIGFDVESSQDGKNFQQIAFVTSRDNRTSIVGYQVSIFQTGHAFYRLKQLEENGSSTYSHTLFVKGVDVEKVWIYPNPAHDKITVSLGQTPSKTQASLYTLQGIERWKTNLLKESTEIDVSQLPKGMYLLKIHQEKSSEVYKILVE